MNRFALIVDRRGAPVAPELLNGVLTASCEGAWRQATTLASGATGYVQVGTKPPAWSNNGACLVLADARIDDRGGLSQYLSAAGIALHSQASAEQAISAAYRAWGNDLTFRLLGDFAFVLWDPTERYLLAARDHFGVRSLYYAEIGDLLAIGNTLEAILAVPGVDRSLLDDTTVCDFLLAGHPLDTGATVYAGIRRVPPAHRLVLHRDGSLRVERYWELPVEPPLRLPRTADYLEAFLERMEVAVADRLGDGRVGISLSGGIDSSTVLALAQDLLRRRGGAYDLGAWTVDSPELWPEGNEGELAAEVAHDFGIPHEVVRPEDYPVFFDPDAALHVPPEPLYSPQHGVFLRQFGEIAAHASVALTGNGSDPALTPACGYLGQLLSKGRIFQFALDLARFVQRRGRLPPICLRSSLTKRLLSKTAERPVFPPWFRPGIIAELDLRQRWDSYLDSFLVPDIDQHPYRPMAYRALTSPHWPFVFWTYSPEVSGVALELAHPFLDLRVVTFLLQLPSVPWCADKWIVREAMEGRLPERVRLRSKCTPRGDPMKRVLKRDRGALPRAFEVARRERARLSRYLRMAVLEQLVGQHERLRSDELALIGRPLALANWLRNNSL